MKSTSTKDKWTAFLMSLVVPGAGQLFAGSWSCLIWFVMAGCLIALLSPSQLEEKSTFLQISVLALFSIVSAEHAKRCLEPCSTSNKRQASKSYVTCQVNSNRSVKLDIQIEIARPFQEVWRDISDVKHFIQVDPFHIRLETNDSQIKQGTTFRLMHRAFGIQFLRVGKILKWEDEQGYAFSDLSSSGGSGMFPHVFFVSISPANKSEEPNNCTCLKVQVRGKWTSPYLPRLLIQFWLRYVCHEHARLLAKVY